MSHCSSDQDITTFALKVVRMGDWAVEWVRLSRLSPTRDSIGIGWGHGYIETNLMSQETQGLIPNQPFKRRKQTFTPGL